MEGFGMSIAAVQEFITKGKLDCELLSHFIDLARGEVTLRFETEIWDYKRELPDLDNPKRVAELAADILAFHNSRGGYIIYGITNDFSILGIHGPEGQDLDSNKINSRLRRFVGSSVICHYACIPLTIGGTRRSLATILVPRRKGIAVKTQVKSDVFNEGVLFLRSNDSRKIAEANSEFLELFTPPEPDVIVGSHQLKTSSPKPGFRLFLGDYASTGFVGEVTRQPIICRTLEELTLGKWDIILLKGVGGVGKTAVATEVTNRLTYDEQWQTFFGGIVSISGKSEQLTPYERSAIASEVTSYEGFLRLIILTAEYAGDIPRKVEDMERVAVQELKEKRILLFIDNFETIETRESRIASFVEQLPAGCKTLLTSRHLPKSLPSLAIEVPPLNGAEAELLARAEGVAQHLEDTVSKSLNQILDISGYVPLAIKWIISCSKNEEHLSQLVEDHRKGKPKLANLCEFCFTFEYNLLSELARRCLVVLPMFRFMPNDHDVAFVLEIEREFISDALDELVDFSLVVREYSKHRNDNVYRLLKLTESFAETKRREYAELERQARKRLKDLYGNSIPALTESAKEMFTNGVTPEALRQFIDQEILSREPQYAEALFWRGRASEKEESFSAASRDYHQAIAHSASSPRVASEAALGLIRLLEHEPESVRKEIVQTLERAYLISPTIELGVQLANVHEILRNTQRALVIYRNVYDSATDRDLPSWEQAFKAICGAIESDRGDKAALDFVVTSIKRFPASKVVRGHERRYMENLGRIRYKSSGL
jgi:tetratricopeptide (TPR) repeat protein